GARALAVASRRSVRGSLAETISVLAATADRMCARRSVVLSSHVTPSSEGLGSPGDRGHGHLAPLLSRPYRHARRPRATARARVSLAFNLASPRTQVRLATSTAPGPSDDAEGWVAHDWTGRNVAHRYHRHPPGRRDTRLSARGDRQLLSTDFSVARGR